MNLGQNSILGLAKVSLWAVVLWIMGECSHINSLSLSYPVLHFNLSVQHLWDTLLHVFPWFLPKTFIHAIPLVGKLFTLWRDNVLSCSSYVDIRSWSHYFSGNEERQEQIFRRTIITMWNCLRRSHSRVFRLCCSPQAKDKRLLVSPLKIQYHLVQHTCLYTRVSCLLQQHIYTQMSSSQVLRLISLPIRALLWHNRHVDIKRLLVLLISLHLWFSSHSLLQYQEIREALWFSHFLFLRLPKQLTKGSRSLTPMRSLLV